MCLRNQCPGQRGRREGGAIAGLGPRSRGVGVRRDDGPGGCSRTCRPPVPGLRHLSLQAVCYTGDRAPSGGFSVTSHGCNQGHSPGGLTEAVRGLHAPEARVPDPGATGLGPPKATVLVVRTPSLPVSSQR